MSSRIDDGRMIAADTLCRDLCILHGAHKQVLAHICLKNHPARVPLCKNGLTSLPKLITVKESFRHIHEQHAGNGSLRRRDSCCRGSGLPALALVDGAPAVSSASACVLYHLAQVVLDHLIAFSVRSDIALAACGTLSSWWLRCAGYQHQVAVHPLSGLPRAALLYLSIRQACTLVECSTVRLCEKVWDGRWTGVGSADRHSIRDGWQIICKNFTGAPSWRFFNSSQGRNCSCRLALGKSYAHYAVTWYSDAPEACGDGWVVALSSTSWSEAAQGSGQHHADAQSEEPSVHVQARWICEDGRLCDQARQQQTSQGAKGQRLVGAVPAATAHAYNLLDSMASVQLRSGS